MTSRRVRGGRSVVMLLVEGVVHRLPGCFPGERVVG